MSTAELRRRNLASILQAVRDSHPAGISRSELAPQVGLTAGTVTRLAGALMNVGLLKEQASSQDGMRGRPRVPITMGDQQAVAGVHIASHRTHIGVVDLLGNVQHVRTLRHRGKRPSTIIGHIGAAIVEMAADSETGFIGLGVALGGWVDPARGLVRDDPALGWHDVDLAGQLTEITALPTRIDSIAFAGLLAERLFGPVRGVDDLLYLFMGNVIGLAVLSGGEAVRGAHAAAGFIDHISVGTDTKYTCTCGRRDCLSSAGNDKLAAEARKKGWLPADADLSVLHDVAHENPHVKRLFTKRARPVGGAVARLIELFDPARVVVRDGNVTDEEYLANLRSSIAANLTLDTGLDPDKDVLPSSFSSGQFSAVPAAILLDAFYRDPATFVAV